MVDQKQCPLCKGNNACNSRSDKPCWCMAEVFPEGISQKLSAEQIRKACICRKCLKSYHLQ